jgi:hypothetical protein
MVNPNERVAPAGGPDGETVTAKHLPADEAQVDVDPAADAASIATASMLAASTKKNPRATVRSAFRMAAPSTYISRLRAA